MAKSQELPKERLATMDAQGNRLKLYPADVSGHYVSIRKKLHAALVCFFLVLPWVQINGHQAVLFDIPNRRFAILGLTFWAHDAPMLFLVFATVALTVALVTAIWGRLWCGWACPETVFTESVFRKIERWIEGSHLKRKQLDNGPFDSKKVVLKTAKWSAFLLVTLIITHSFLAYFVGTSELMNMIQTNPAENPTSFLIMLVSSAIILIAFGSFREQFCVIMCPYGRIQALLMDENSLTVAYDEKRGEPRRAKENPKETQGDCIDCFKCVSACPTGIDIRRGLQMECIACTACIDACDSVMTQIGKPKGLIRYDTEKGIKNEKNKPFGARTIIYGALIFLSATVLAGLILFRPPLDINILRAKDIPYQQVFDEKGEALVINHLRLGLSNYQFENAIVTIETKNKEEIELVQASSNHEISGGADSKSDFFIRFPKRLLTNGNLKTELIVRAKFKDSKKTHEAIQSVHLVGPFQ